MAALIEIYSTSHCPYCVRAKALLRHKGVTAWTEYDIAHMPDRMAEMHVRSQGRKTVPQIFIDGMHIGGFDDLNLLNQKGDLDALL